MVVTVAKTPSVHSRLSTRSHTQQEQEEEEESWVAWISSLTAGGKIQLLLNLPNIPPTACFIHFIHLHPGLGLPLARDKRSRNLTKSIHLDQLQASKRGELDTRLILFPICQKRVLVRRQISEVYEERI